MGGGTSGDATAKDYVVGLIAIAGVIWIGYAYFGGGESEEDAAARAAACRDDLQCWADEHAVAAAVACRPRIEAFALINYEWADGGWATGFARTRWLDRQSGQLTYLGDDVRFQNGFGAWIIHTYECDYDPATDTVLEVRVDPGQLPPG